MNHIQYYCVLPLICQAYGFLTADHQYVSRKDEGDKLIVVERGDLVFVWNFHPSNSYTDYRIGCYKEGQYKVGWVIQRGALQTDLGT